MNRPLFSVGEKVLLQSESYPWYNGVYVVEKLVKPGERIIDRIKEGVQTLSPEEDGICYILDEPLKMITMEGRFSGDSLHSGRSINHLSLVSIS